MPSQWRNEQSGGGQATGRMAKPVKVPMASGPKQTDNGTKAGTTKVPLTRVPGVR